MVSVFIPCAFCGLPAIRLCAGLLVWRSGFHPRQLGLHKGKALHFD